MRRIASTQALVSAAAPNSLTHTSNLRAGGDSRRDMVLRSSNSRQVPGLPRHPALPFSKPVTFDTLRSAHSSACQLEPTSRPTCRHPSRLSRTFGIYHTPPLGVADDHVRTSHFLRRMHVSLRCIPRSSVNRSWSGTKTDRQEYARGT
jgi:hypothetical protein